MLSNRLLKSHFHDRILELEALHAEHTIFMKNSLRQNFWCKRTDDQKLRSITSLHDLNLILFRIFQKC